MESVEGRQVVTFNGEIYNFREIREELETIGCRFRTQSDTEVILEAYRVWGTDCVKRFNGMFAFALWDEIEERLWVVRDRMGVKPLYYQVVDGRFSCASEIKPLLALESRVPALNEGVLDAFFSIGYVPAPQTMFEGIQKLEPGCFLEVDRERVRQTRYWDFAEIDPIEGSDDELTERFEGLLRSCVDLCTVSDVPIGVLLSGGLDSSSIVAMMNRCGVDPINSFTVGFDGTDEYSEEDYAREVAAHYRCRQFVHILREKSFADSISTLVQFSEEPLVEPAAIALYHLAQTARSENKVVLSGEGADEILAGYGLYHKMSQLERVHACLPAGAWRYLQKGGRSVIGSSHHLKYLDWVSSGLEERYRGTSSILTSSSKTNLYSADFSDSRGDYLDSVFRSHFDRLPVDRDPLSRMLYVDSKTWLVDDLLLKADKMTMAASIELRVPFLDHRLVEFASSLPTRVKLRKGNGKWILRKAVGSNLPESISTRSKLGFPVPTERWLRSDTFQRVKQRLMEPNQFPWIRMEAIRKVFDSKQLNSDEVRFVMALVVLDEWRNHFGIRS